MEMIWIRLSIYKYFFSRLLFEFQKEGKKFIIMVRSAGLCFFPCLFSDSADFVCVPYFFVFVVVVVIHSFLLSNIPIE